MQENSRFTIINRYSQLKTVVQYSLLFSVAAGMGLGTRIECVHLCVKRINMSLQIVSDLSAHLHCRIFFKYIISFCFCNWYIMHLKILQVVCFWVLKLSHADNHCYSQLPCRNASMWILGETGSRWLPQYSHHCTCNPISWYACGTE